MLSPAVQTAYRNVPSHVSGPQGAKIKTKVDGMFEVKNKHKLCQSIMYQYPEAVDGIRNHFVDEFVVQVRIFGSPTLRLLWVAGR